MENAKCKRPECGYSFKSTIVTKKGIPPKQCPVCKRYNVVEIKK